MTAPNLKAISPAFRLVKKPTTIRRYSLQKIWLLISESGFFAVVSTLVPLFSWDQEIVVA
jgi:hypothetical protein